MTTAVLFDGIQIEIDERSAQMGGSWQWTSATGQPMAYDSELVRFFFNQVRNVHNPVIVDVGASTGSFSLLPLLHKCTVVAFEPNPAAYDVLVANINLNDLGDRVHAHRVALSDVEGRGVLQVAEDATHAALCTLGTSRYTDTRWNELEVVRRTLDSYNLQRVDFLKVDVEGAELMVLRGAEETIRRCKPAILVEYQALNTRQCGYGPEDIAALLQSWGYDHFQRVGLEDLWAKKKVSVALCTPICGPPTWDYLDSIVQWQARHYLEHPDISVKVIRPKRSAPVAMARNTLAEKFLASDCDYMWLVDDDAKYPVGTLDRLMSWNVDMIGALCMMRRDECVLPSAFRGLVEGDIYRLVAADVYAFIGEHYNYESNDPQILDVPPEGSLYSVDFTGCHCLLVKRAVVEKMEPPWFAGRLGLEDKYFCLRAKEHGFGVYVDLSVFVGHSIERCVGAFDFMSGYWFMAQLEEKRNAERDNGNGRSESVAVLQDAAKSGDV